MDEKTFLKHLDAADKDLDAFPFWRIFKKACADNPFKGIKKTQKLLFWKKNIEKFIRNPLLKNFNNKSKCFKI